MIPLIPAQAADTLPELPHTRTNARQDATIRLVRAHGYMSHEELAQHFGVTVQTIRRDVGFLSEQGLICRHHGGATPASTIENIAYDARQILNLEAKNAIGRCAARLVPDQSSLFINIGTTAEAFARALTQHRALRVITNNLHVASQLCARQDFRTVIAGGHVRSQDGAIVGAGAIESLSSFRAEFGIIGTSGIEEDGTLLDFDLDEIQCARTIIRHSRRVILLADHTKFHRHPMGRVGNLSDIDDLVTDRPVSADFRRSLEEHRVRLHLSF